MSMLMLMSIPALIVTLMLMHEFTLMRMTMRMPVLMLILMFILMLMAMLMRMHLLMLALMLMSVLMRLVCSDSPDAPYYPFLLLELSAFPSLFPPTLLQPSRLPRCPNVSPQRLSLFPFVRSPATQTTNFLLRSASQISTARFSDRRHFSSRRARSPEIWNLWVSGSLRL